MTPPHQPRPAQTARSNHLLQSTGVVPNLKFILPSTRTRLTSRRTVSSLHPRALRRASCFAPDALTKKCPATNRSFLLTTSTQRPPPNEAAAVTLRGHCKRQQLRHCGSRRDDDIDCTHAGDGLQEREHTEGLSSRTMAARRRQTTRRPVPLTQQQAANVQAGRCDPSDTM